MTEYVQAWEITSPRGFNGYVYTQSIALDKLSSNEGAEMRILTIVRHDNGDREYLPGTLASEVQKYRETR